MNRARRRAKWRAEYKRNKARYQKYNRAYYHAHKKEIVAASHRCTKQRRLWLREIKTSLGCSRCSENHWACLEFHHVKKKRFGINRAMATGVSKKKILSEIKRCVLLCANCHRKEHCDE